jgi:hypothetical protein
MNRLHAAHITTILTLALASCAPMVNTQATQSAMESMHAAETKTAMEAMDGMHAEETQTAMEAMDTMHATETETAMQTMHAEETQTAMEAMPAMMTMSTGVFMALQHKGAGTAAIVGSEADGYHLELTGFSVEDGPDLHVVLTSQAMPDKMATTLADAVDLGLLTAMEGDLSFAIPAGTDLSKAAAVVIWCEDFSVPFTFAALQAP